MGEILNAFGGAAQPQATQRFIGQFPSLGDLPDATQLLDDTLAWVMDESTYYKVTASAWALFAEVGGSAGLAAHLADVANPHVVTKAQVGLGNLANVLDNLEAVAPPTVNDDVNAGYLPTSLWIVNHLTPYTCVSNAAGAAVWVSSSSDAQSVQGVAVDATALADGRALVYNSATGNLEYTDMPAANAGAPTITEVTNPASPLSQALVHGDHIRIALNGDCTINFTGTPLTTKAYQAKVFLRRAGHTVTWGTNVVADSSVDLSGPDGTEERLIVEFMDVGGGSFIYYVSQYAAVGIASAAATLPATSLVHQWDFTTDFSDSVGSVTLVGAGGAAVSATPPFGIDFAALSSQYVEDTTTSGTDTNADWTYFVAFRLDTTDTNERFIMTLGNWSTNPWLALIADGSLATPRLRVLNKAANATFGGTVEVNYADISAALGPNADQLWMIRRSGATLTLQCLTDPTLTDTDTMVVGSNYTTARLTIGAKGRNAPNDDFFDGLVYLCYVYSDDILVQATIDAVRDYIRAASGRNLTTV